MLHIEFHLKKNRRGLLPTESKSLGSSLTHESAIMPTGLSTAIQGR